MGHIYPPVGLFTPQGDLIPQHARLPGRVPFQKGRLRVVFGLARWHGREAASPTLDGLRGQHTGMPSATYVAGF